MSTLASISYITPNAFVHIADDMVTGLICVQVCDGRTEAEIQLNEWQVKQIRDDLIKRFPIDQ